MSGSKIDRGLAPTHSPHKLTSLTQVARLQGGNAFVSLMGYDFLVNYRFLVSMLDGQKLIID